MTYVRHKITNNATLWPIEIEFEAEVRADNSVSDITSAKVVIWFDKKQGAHAMLTLDDEALAHQQIQEWIDRNAAEWGKMCEAERQREAEEEDE